ncbi:hypothetical protein D4764_03G0006030 [Takifugu flavidus]|uniref:Uncharacterized protein n=1 Tax=Takifugu flavidus TaxID=433684 RepID=A0A5C6N8Y2_9TELE|nr:hypothetical protein D4764_03G0006030 [Takifugu flavidus]
MPPENVSDEAFMAHFPAKLVPPSLQSAPTPTPVPPPRNGQELYKLQEDTQDTDTSDSDDDSEEVYIKKPPNAFMLFMTEQRPNISRELWRKGSSTVNSYLATMVRDLDLDDLDEPITESGSSRGFMRIPDEGVCTLNPPQELCMENTVVGPVPDHVLEER